MLSFILLSAITFFPGYLVLSVFFKKQLSRIPFFVALPVFFGMGLCIQILISVLAGAYIVGLYVPLGITIASVFGVLIFLVYKSRADKKRLFYFRIGYPGSIFLWKNVFALALVLFTFTYFVNLAVDKGWPPVGDAIMHSTITSNILKDGSSVQRQPFEPFPAVYPTGYHSFAADFSLFANIYPGESVYVIATFTLIIFSMLLFTLSYVLTNSVWLSLPSAFSALMVHSSGQLERWIGGFLWNGPYPSLFAFTAVICALIFLELNYRQSKSIFTVFPVLALIVLSLVVGYPNFVPHVLIFLVAYLIIRNTIRIKNYVLKFTRAVLFPLLNIRIDHSDVRKEDTDMTDQKKIAYSHEGIILSADHRIIDSTKFPKIATIAILVMFTASFIIVGLPSLYQKLISFNLGVFEIRKDFEYIKFQEVWRNFNSDILSRLAIMLEITSFALILAIKKRIEPVFVAAFLLLATLLFQQLGFLYPQRTLTFIATLSWPLVAFAISELKPNRVNLYKSKINSDHLVIPVFVALALVIQVPSILSQIETQPGWYIFDIFPNSYATAEWLSHNSNSSDLILNDRTYSSFYTNGFALRNLTHTYMSGWLKTLPADWPSEFEMMSRNLSKIWDIPWDKDMVSDLLKKYDVKFIVLFEDDKFTDWTNWGGDDIVAGTQKPYSNGQYEYVFSSYEFLDLVFKKGDSLVYRVLSN